MWRDGKRKPEAPAERCDATGKIRYRTDKLALYAAVGFKRRKGSKFGRKEPILEPYPCNECGDWHIGHGMNTQRNSHRRRPKREKGRKKGR